MRCRLRQRLRQQLWSLFAIELGEDDCIETLLNVLVLYPLQFAQYISKRLVYMLGNLRRYEPALTQKFGVFVELR